MNSGSPKSAIAAAAAAQRTWGALPVAERVERLQPAADLLAGRMDYFVEQIHDENGKPPVEALAHEILPAVAYVRWLLDAAPTVLGEQRRSVRWLPHRRFAITRRPYGVVLVISPWNIPFLIPFTQVVGALAAGNAAVLKPSEVTPRSADLIAEVLAACDLPEGLFQVVQGDGRVGAELVEARPDKVLFTGSVATGRKVMTACAAHPIPVGLELGGIDVLVVCDDADLEYASSAIAWGGTFNHGQICASVERVLAHERIHDDLVARVVDKMQRIDARTDMGRVTFDGQRKVIDRHLADAVERGCDVRCGGAWLNDDQLAPTLITGRGVEGSLAWREETFGPVVAVLPFSHDDQAVRLHNDTRFGLTASVFSRNKARARRIAERLDAGNVAINEIAAMHYSQPELPWGGRGESGFGRSHGPEGLLEVTWSQTIDESAVGSGEPKRPWWYPYDQDQYHAIASLVRATAARSVGDRVSAVVDTGRRVLRSLSRAARI